MYKKFFILGACAGSLLAMAQNQPKDTIALSEIQVIAELPITNEVITKKQIESKNLGQDMPILLKNATGVVTTSDAGAGVGYTGIRIRGVKDQINVTFNGVPVNDSESHGVYWVDFPDVSSSTQGVVIQRGVGTSSNGATSFGASVNLDTEHRRTDAFGEAMATYGSFNTQKYMLSGGTGDIANGKFNVDARQSYVKSDGYRDRASSDLYSTAINARYMPSKNTEIHLMNIFGYEKTYQAWNYTKEKDIRKSRTFNPSGAIYGSTGIIDYYDNEIDNYTQNHTHLYWKQKYGNGWRSKATLHYTRGVGYYENYDGYASTKDLLSSYYSINVNKLGKSVDNGSLAVIARRWLDNHFFGGIFNIENTQLGDTKLYAGVAANKYIGGHYGEAIGIEKVVNDRRVKVNDYIQDGYFYNNESEKVELTSFVKVLQKVGDFELFGDIQSRHISYSGQFKQEGQDYWDNAPFKPFGLTYNFINPKAGFNYRFNNTSKVYFSYGLAHKEPTRDDILGGNVKPETLHDFELGYRVQNSVINLGANVYYMRYKDQLVFTGKIDNVGAPIRESVGDSYRTGVELDVNAAIVPNTLNLFGNLAWSKNKNVNYYQKENGKQISYGDTDISYSPNLISSFGVDYTVFKDFNLNFTNKYVSSQYVTNTQNEDLKLADYFVSDLLLSYNFKLGGSTMELSALVNNLFDKDYYSKGKGKMDNGVPKMKYFPQAGRNFLAGVKFRF